MKKIKKMAAEHLYLIRGASVTATPFFEHEADCQLFLELANRYLGAYMDITSFQNNRDGWVMMIITKSAKVIKRAYQARRATSKKCKKAFEFKEIWQMLSDQIRILLSTYVKRTNQATGRSGAKVRRRYERFLFEDESEALAMKEKLETEYYDQAQAEERYQPSDDSHSLTQEMIRTSIYMGCALLHAAEKMSVLGLGCVDVGVLDESVARRLVEATYTHHFGT